MTTLENSFCVPMGEEWDIFGLIPLTGHKVMWLGGEPTLVSGTFNDRTEIPVPRFLDLMHDRIVPWRLEEFGFDTHPQGLPRFAYKIKKAGSIVVVFQNENPNPAIYIMSAKDVTPVNLTTFTDLMTLIRMLTPPSK